MGLLSLLGGGLLGQMKGGNGLQSLLGGGLLGQFSGNDEFQGQLGQILGGMGPGAMQQIRQPAAGEPQPQAQPLMPVTPQLTGLARLAARNRQFFGG